MTKRYNAMLDVAFTVVSKYEDWQEIPVHVILDALKQRVHELGEMPPEEALEAFGFSDQYEEYG